MRAPASTASMTRLASASGAFISRRAFLFVLQAFGLAGPARKLFRPRLEPCSFGRFPKLLIECRQDDLLADGFLPCQSRRELDGTVAAQPVFPCQRVGSL